MSPKTSSFADPQSWRPREPQGCEERGNALTGLVPTSASRDPALRLLGKEAPVLILKHSPEGRGFWAASSPSGGGPSFQLPALPPPCYNHLATTIPHSTVRRGHFSSPRGASCWSAPWPPSSRGCRGGVGLHSGSPSIAGREFSRAQKPCHSDRHRAPSTPGGRLK